MSSTVWIIYFQPWLGSENHENKSYDKTRFEKFKSRGNKNKPQADDLQSQRNANTNVEDIIESVGDLFVMLDARSWRRAACIWGVLLIP